MPTTGGFFSLHALASWRMQQRLNTAGDLKAFVAGEPRLAAVWAGLERRPTTDVAHDLQHALRVAVWTLKIAPELDACEAVAAALLHDFVNVPKDSDARAAASEQSAAQAREVLEACAFDSQSIERISVAIRTHSYSRGEAPTTPLGRALQDADRLEALGALGICRTLSTGARLGARYFDPEDPWAERRPLDDLQNTVDHFFTKLLGLVDSMQTPLGRAEAERRSDFMRQFLRQLGEELGISVQVHGHRSLG